MTRLTFQHFHVTTSMCIFFLAMTCQWMTPIHAFSTVWSFRVSPTLETTTTTTLTGHTTTSTTGTQLSAMSFKKSDEESKEETLSSSITTSTSSTLTTPTLVVSTAVTSWEIQCQRQMEDWYHQTSSLKCPFWKRRFADGLDSLHQLLRFLSIRHKSLLHVELLEDVWGPPPGCRSATTSTSTSSATNQKLLDLTLAERLTLLEHDWKSTTTTGTMQNKGYYITGRLTQGLYQDDCVFDGPDPDMPVVGLRKYIAAASQLFDPKHSTAELLSLELIEPESGAPPRMVAKWKLQGVLQLPWKPSLPTWEGTTTYILDPQSQLIARHEETWEISVWQAFGETLLPPWISQRLWHSTITKDATGN